jgi:DNA-directed RNA polymerase beta subunit
MSKNSSFYDEDLSTLSSEFYGRIYKDIIKRDGFSSNIIENYNNEMIFKIPELIMNTKFEARDGYITFENVRPLKPTDTVRGKIEPLFPRDARMKTIPYFADIVGDVVFTPRPIGYLPNGQAQYAEGATIERKENFEIGAVPVMLGSQLCHLYGLSEEELLEKGECIGDPFGYFIIKSERIIITQSKLRVSAFLIYNDAKRKSVFGGITCPTEQGRMVVGIQIHPKYKFLRVILQYMLKNQNTDGMSIFLIFKVLGVDVDKAIQMIKKYIPEENHNKADYALQPSIAEFNSINAVTQEDYVEYIKQQRNHWERNDTIKIEQIVPDIQNQLFYDSKKLEDKLEHLAMYGARMVEIVMGTREIDDRDSWGSCQLETAGKLLTQLFKEIWTPIRKFLDIEIRKGEGLRAFTNAFKANQIKDNFISAFGPNAWGSKNRLRSGKEGDNITESLKRDTPVAIFSQITKVTNTKASRESKDEKLRMVHPSQLGFLDLFETPDGEGNGLVKNLTASCYISLERDPTIYQAMMRPEGPLGKYIYADKMDETMTPFLLNGKIQGWCYPKELVKKLKAMRKNGNEIQKDVCIFYNDNNRCVEMFCDGGRPTRPLFVVDEDQQLVIKKKRLENTDIPTLIREGCIEYIDAREQEYITISERVEKIDERNRKIMEVENLVEQSEKLDIYIPYIKDVVNLLINDNPDDKRFEKPLKMINSIVEKTDIEKEQILQDVATILRNIFTSFSDYEKYKKYLTDDIYDTISTNSKQLETFEISKLPKYDYCEIDPVAIFSPSVAIIPMTNRQAGPRSGFQSNMNKQALTQYHSNEAIRFDASYKMIYYPTRALFQTDMQDDMGINRMANGQTLTVAIIAHPDNPEDGIVFKEEAIKYGCKFDMAKKQTTISIATSNNDYSEYFQRPEIKPGIREGIYDALDENGIPRLDAYIRQGDCIVGKIRKYNNNKDNPKAGTTEEIGEYAGVGEEGFVDRVLVVQNVKRDTVVKVKIRKNRKYIPGDKLACLTDDHEVLLENDIWVPISKVNIKDKVATLNYEHKIEYHRPSVTYAYSAKGEKLYDINTNDISMTITQNHRLYYSFDKINWQLDEAKNLSHYSNIYLKTFNSIVSVNPLIDFIEVECKDAVYCISVENQVFVVRKNGKIHYTGNSRYSQKGTVSKVVPARYLPRIADGPNKGLVPDIIINPYGLLSRMTINKIIEIRSSKAAAISGRFFNATTFRNYKPEMDFVEKTLVDYGLDPNCDENFIFPDGTPIQNKVFFGPCHYQALRHHVSDKIQMRAKQGVKPNTRQPVSGRSKEGGLKVGEMERDALISHGSSALLRERLMDVSDAYTLPICSTCGTIAITDHRNKIYKCNLCREKAKIGTIRIPYVAKLLLFFLNACGIHMTFNTESAFIESGRPEERFLV